jgi:transcriptional regulator of acetoin/glycerol metabolism
VSAALRARLLEVERAELLSAIERARGNKSRAARLLRVSRKTLYARMRRHGIAADDRG